MRNSRSIGRFFVLLLALSLILTACAAPATPAAPQATEAPAEAPAAEPETPFRVAFIYSSPIGDMGFTFAHDQARQIVEKELGVETTYVENIADGSPDAERIMRDFAQKGYNAIISCSGGFADEMAEVAKEYPNTNFLAMSGYQVDDNYGNFGPRLYQSRYLSGIVAGMMTKTNLVGYVAGVPTPDVILALDAFALGLRSANPEATMRLVWTNAWYDPVKETDAANALLEQGADILTYHVNTTSTLKAAADKGKLGIGYSADMSKVAPESVITSAIAFWEVYYLDAIQRMLDGTWKGEAVFWGIEKNMVGLAPYNSLVPQEVKDAVEASRQKFAEGEFDVFWGPIYGQNGELSVPEGKKLTDEEIRTIDWLVQGIEGTAPGKPPVVTD